MISVALLLWAHGAIAQVAPGDELFTVAGGYGFGEATVSGETIDGGSISFAFDKLGGAKPLSILFAFGYSTLTSDTQESGELVKRSISSVPFYLGAKYWLGQGKLQAYAGAAVGVYFSRLETTVIATEESFTAVQSTGWGMAVPLGLSVALTDDVLLNGGLVTIISQLLSVVKKSTFSWITSNPRSRKY